MGYYVIDSLGVERNLGQNYLDGGQLEFSGGQKVFSEFCLVGVRDI